MNIKEISKEIHENNVKKGFWPEDKSTRNKGELLMLIVSELAEALEADRENFYADKHNFIGWYNRSFDKSFDEWNILAKKSFEETIKNSFEDELADVAIRLFDVAEGFGIDLEWHIEQKLKYNKLREHKHGKKY